MLFSIFIENNINEVYLAASENPSYLLKNQL